VKISLTLWQIEMIPWYVIGVYWAITWLQVKRTRMTESLALRLGTILPIALAFELLFSKGLRIGLLGMRFLPDDDWIRWSGVALTGVGVAVAIWARYCLGQYWSAEVTLKEGHRVIRSGPYGRVRHPIYTGILVAAIGTALVLGEWRGVLAVGVIWAAHFRKALREEALLSSELGEEYAHYRRSTGFLLPRFRKGGCAPSPREPQTGRDLRA
jgi:protein-S-isoprenylcysteine O-methyltransferase Ste14